MLAACEAGEVFALLEGAGAGARQAADALSALFCVERGAWVSRALLAYHARTGSVRVLDVLARAPDGHARHLLDALLEHARGDPAARHHALAALAALVARRPAWLHRLPSHPMLPELMRTARAEPRVEPLLHALLALAALLPAAPALAAAAAPDLTDALLHVAALQPRPSPPARVHLHLAQLALFHAMYATTPCTLIDTLRSEHASLRDDARVPWEHVVLPLLDSVRVHPALVTDSRAREADATRWARLELHDAVAESRRLSLPPSGVPPAPTPVPTPVPLLAAPASPALGSGAHAARTSLWPGGESWFALGERCGADSAPQTPLPADADSTEPPEAAVEATPENTPAKETRAQFRFPVDSAAVRALGRRSQPPSPMRKETSPSGTDVCSAAGGGAAGARLTRVALDRAALDADGGGGGAGRRAADSPVPFGGAPPPAGASIARPEPSRLLPTLDAEDREVLELTTRSVTSDPWTSDAVDSEDGQAMRLVWAARELDPRRLVSAAAATGGGGGATGGPGAPRRRAASCPPRVAGRARHSVATQTVDSWPAPYEFLIADFYRPHHSLDDSDIQNVRDEAKKSSGKIEAVEWGGAGGALAEYLRDVYSGGGGGGDKRDVNERLALAHAQLLYERWRREVHAERNRRLLGRCRAARAHQLQADALRERLRGALRERDELRARLARLNSAGASSAEEAREAAGAAGAQLQVEREARARAEAALREAECARAADGAELQRARSQAWEAARALEALARGARGAERRAEHVRALRRELLVLGERHARLQAAARPAPAVHDGGAARALRERAAAAARDAEAAGARADSAAARLHEAEAALAQRDAQLADMKRSARAAADEGEARRRALSDKYAALQCVLRRQEALRLRTLAGPAPPPARSQAAPAPPLPARPPPTPADCSRVRALLDEG